MPPKGRQPRSSPPSRLPAFPRKRFVQPFTRGFCGDAFPNSRRSAHPDRYGPPATSITFPRRRLVLRFTSRFRGNARSRTWTTRWAKARDMPRSRNGGPGMSNSGSRPRCARLLVIPRSRLATTLSSRPRRSGSYEAEIRHACQDALPHMPLRGPAACRSWHRPGFARNMTGACPQPAPGCSGWTQRPQP